MGKEGQDNTYIHLDPHPRLYIYNFKPIPNPLIFFSKLVLLEAR